MISSEHASLPILANSLSILTELASNPPSKPRESQRIASEPLVLYVARVPGRRDVFLTPLKPRSKTVTAEDVESCLYYLHFDCAEDERLLADQRLTQHQSSESRLWHHPLPPLPERGLKKPELAPRQFGSPMRRKPVGDTGRDPNWNAPLSLPSPQDRQENTFSSRSWDLSPPSITLVRRDPASGEQWNIAKIVDPPVHEVSSVKSPTSPTRSSQASGTPMYIDIFNSGYEKFCVRPAHHDHSPSISGNITPDTLPSLGYSSSSGTVSSTTNAGTFKRRLWMEGSHFGSKKSRQIAAIEYAPNKLVQRSSFDDPTHEGVSPGGFDSQDSLPLHDGRLLTKDERRSAIKGYTFMSPWNGRCEFGVSTFGNSLKCRHRLPGRSDVSQVSELRFNLPSHSKHKKSSSQSLAVPRTTPISGGPRTGKSLSASHIDANDIWDDDSGQLDLSLGQELAGGGATGKQAKLGKLIINEEGLQMMDLVTAANMALWWRAYERVS